MGTKSKNNVTKGKEWQPNPKQIKMAELLLNPEDRRTKKEKCAEVDISFKTLWTWMKDKRFVEYVNGKLNQYTDAAVPEVWRSLINQCNRGNVSAMRLFYELKELLPSQKMW